jgi:hypothetical protein
LHRRVRDERRSSYTLVDWAAKKGQIAVTPDKRGGLNGSMQHHLI